MIMFGKLNNLEDRCYLCLLEIGSDEKKINEKPNREAGAISKVKTNAGIKVY